jgi:hypothetical protein
LPEDEISRIEALIGRAEENEPTLDNATKARIRLRVGQDRSKIVLIVFLVYLGVISAIIFYLLYRGYFCQEMVFDSFTEVMKIAVIPIVTLVIGYYFGSEKAEQS